MIILPTQFLVLIGLLLALLIGVALFVGIACFRKSERPWYRNSLLLTSFAFLCIVAIGILALLVSVFFFATPVFYGPPHTSQFP